MAAPVVNQNEETDLTQATDAYFNGRVELGSSRYDTPLVEASGYGDIREGAEEHPEYWRHIDDRIQQQAAALAKIDAAKKSESSSGGKSCSHPFLFTSP